MLAWDKPRLALPQGPLRQAGPVARFAEQGLFLPWASVFPALQWREKRRLFREASSFLCQLPLSLYSGPSLDTTDQTLEAPNLPGQEANQEG